MPRGPNGEWGPADPNACAVHVGEILTGQIAETFAPPADQRKPPDPASGGRARAAKMTAEERSASAKRAASARWGAAVLAALLLAPAPAAGQAVADRAALEVKTARMDLAGPPAPMVRGLVWPSEQTARRPYFGFRLIVGAPYNPITSPRDTWIWIGCISADPRVAYDSDSFGSGLVRVHALIYEVNRDGSLNADTVISTAETTELDEAICDLENGVDTSFLEIPRSFNAAVVSLFSVPRRTQYVEVVENIERTLPQ